MKHAWNTLETCLNPLETPIKHHSCLCCCWWHELPHLVPEECLPPVYGNVPVHGPAPRVPPAVEWLDPEHELWSISQLHHQYWTRGGSRGQHWSSCVHDEHDGDAVVVGVELAEMISYCQGLWWLHHYNVAGVQGDGQPGWWHWVIDS